MNLNEFNLRRWTQGAKDCLSVGCVCEKCSIYHKFFKHSARKCQMKRFVIESVKRFGHPKDIKAKTIIGEE